MQHLEKKSVVYDIYRSAPAFALDEERYFLDLIRASAASTVLEVGSGANPTLSADHARQLGFHYVTSDVNVEELRKAPTGTDARVIDVEYGPMPADLVGSCDMVFSRWVGEHVRDGRRYHQNVRSLLRPGGIAVHCFPCLYAAPFFVNRIVSEDLSATLLSFFSRRDEFQHGKFRAYYSWCRGPSSRAIRHFNEIGFDVVEYDGYYGHYYYEKKFPLLHRMELLKSRFLVSHPIPQLCAFATVILRRPMH